MLGTSDGLFDPKTIRVLGLKVALRKEHVSEEIDQGGIILPNSTVEGFKGCTGIVLAAGDEAIDQYGLAVGDRVKFDQCGMYHDTHPVIILNAENIIIRVDKDDNHIPLKDMVFVKKLGAISSFLQDDILISDKNSDIAIGEVTAVDNDSLLNIGDKLIMTTECDVVNSASGPYYIFKQTDIMATITF